MTIEIVIIVMLLASLFGAWVLSVWRKLEMQEENIRNALHQTLVQLSAEREALEKYDSRSGYQNDRENY